MTDENTTASEPTTETPTAGTETGSSTSSTTATETPPADDTAVGTILTGEDKPTDDTTTDTTAGATDEATPFYGAPEGDYELSGLPEGTVIDTDALAAIAPIAKELNLSNDGLSKIAGVYAEQVLPKVAENLTNQLQQDVAAQHAAWATETQDLIKSDPVFTGKSLKDVQQVSAKTLDRFGGQEFRNFLDQTGLGNHPAMVKFAYQVGSAISEDTTFERGDPTPKPKSRTEKYYGA